MRTENVNKYHAAVGESFVHAKLTEMAIAREQVENRAAKRTFLIWAAPMVLLLLSMVMSGSALITPLPTGLLWSVRIVGAFGAGLLVWQSRKRLGQDILQSWKRFLVGPAFMVFVAIFLEIVTWHVANLWEFAISSAPVESATYPIVAADYGRRMSSATISIDPFDVGFPLKIPIPDEQFLALQKRQGPLCARVEQRRSKSGAIQVFSNGRFLLFSPTPVQIGACPIARK